MQAKKLPGKPEPAEVSPETEEASKEPAAVSFTPRRQERMRSAGPCTRRILGVYLSKSPAVKKNPAFTNADNLRKLDSLDFNFERTLSKETLPILFLHSEKFGIKLSNQLLRLDDKTQRKILHLKPPLEKPPRGLFKSQQNP